MSRNHSSTRCAIAQRFISAERNLREAVNRTLDMHKAALVGNRIIECQRKRFQHEKNCALCLALEAA
jgi:hypothetical protein